MNSGSRHVLDLRMGKRMVQSIYGSMVDTLRLPFLEESLPEVYDRLQNSLLSRITSALVTIALIFTLIPALPAEAVFLGSVVDSGLPDLGYSAVATSNDGSIVLAAQADSACMYSCTDGDLYLSTDSGQTWSDAISVGSPKYWTGVDMSSDGSKMVAVARVSDYIYTSDDGYTWTPQPAAGQREWTGVAMSSDGTKIVALSNEGYIYTSTNGGLSWTERTGAGSHMWVDVTMSSDGTKIAVAEGAKLNGGQYGYIYTSNDSGATWTQRTGAGQRQWQGIAYSADGGKLYAVAIDNTQIYYSTNNGSTWATISGNNGYTDIDISSDGTKIVALDYSGTISTFENNANLHNPGQADNNGYSYASVISGDGTRGYFASLTRLAKATPIAAPTVTTSAASSVSAITATLNGNITATGGATPTTRGFAYGTDSTLATVIATSSTSGSYSTGGFTADITGLATTTTYYARAFATNTQGTSFGSIQSFTTTGPVAPTVLFDYYTTNYDRDTSATSFHLIASSTSNGGGPITQYGFVYSTDPDFMTSVSTTTVGNNLEPGSTFEETVENLEPGYLYRVRAYAINSAGVGYSLGISIGTNYKSEPVTTSGNSSSVTTTSATVSGSTVSGDAVKINQLSTVGTNNYIRQIKTANSGSIILLATSNDYLYKSIDSGSTWSPITASGVKDWDDVAISEDGQTIIASPLNEAPGTVTVSHDGGSTWNSVDTGSSGTYSNGISISDDGTTAYATFGGIAEQYIYKSANGGDSWSALTNAGQSNNWVIDITSDGNTIAAINSSRGDVMLSTNGGSTWTTKNVGSLPYIRSVNISSDGSKIRVLGYMSDDLHSALDYIYLSNDAGTTWATSTTLVTLPLRPAGSIISYPEGESLGSMLAVTNSLYSEPNGYNAILFTPDDGLSWRYKENLISDLAQYYPPVIAHLNDNRFGVMASLRSGDGNIIFYEMYVTDDTVTTRGFTYGPTTAYGATTTSSGTFSPGSFTANLTDLTCNTTYHYRSYVTNPAGTGYGDDATFTTAACPATTAVTNGPVVVQSTGNTAQAGATALPNAPQPRLQTRYPDGTVVYHDAPGNTGAPTGITSGGQGGTYTPPTAPLPRYLSYRATGEDVRTLQKFLNDNGFPLAPEGPGSPGNETIFFGIRTLEALKAYQAQRGLPATGFFGPLTKAVVGE